MRGKVFRVKLFSFSLLFFIYVQATYSSQQCIVERFAQDIADITLDTSMNSYEAYVRALCHALKKCSIAKKDSGDARLQESSENGNSATQSLLVIYGINNSQQAPSIQNFSSSLNPYFSNQSDTQQYAMPTTDPFITSMLATYGFPVQGSRIQ
jgi:hypothetical protein